MTCEEIKRNRETLTKILAEEDADKRLEELQRLTKEVGTSVTRMVRAQTGHDASKVYCTVSNEITESKIIHNIQASPKTETMINTCKVSVKHYKVYLLATIIALLTMLANWAIVLVMLRTSE